MNINRMPISQSMNMPQVVSKLVQDVSKLLDLTQQQEQQLHDLKHRSNQYVTRSDLESNLDSMKTVPFYSMEGLDSILSQQKSKEITDKSIKYKRPNSTTATNNQVLSNSEIKIYLAYLEGRVIKLSSQNKRLENELTFAKSAIEELVTRIASMEGKLSTQSFIEVKNPSKKSLMNDSILGDIESKDSPLNDIHISQQSLERKYNLELEAFDDQISLNERLSNLQTTKEDLVKRYSTSLIQDLIKDSVEIVKSRRVHSTIIKLPSILPVASSDDSNDDKEDLAYRKHLINSTYDGHLSINLSHQNVSEIMHTHHQSQEVKDESYSASTTWRKKHLSVMIVTPSEYVSEADDASDLSESTNDLPKHTSEYPQDLPSDVKSEVSQILHLTIPEFLLDDIRDLKVFANNSFDKMNQLEDLISTHEGMISHYSQLAISSLENHSSLQKMIENFQSQLSQSSLVYDTALDRQTEEMNRLVDKVEKLESSMDELYKSLLLTEWNCFDETSQRVMNRSEKEKDHNRNNHNNHDIDLEHTLNITTKIDRVNLHEVKKNYDHPSNKEGTSIVEDVAVIQLKHESSRSDLLTLPAYIDEVFSEMNSIRLQHHEMMQEYSKLQGKISIIEQNLAILRSKPLRHAADKDMSGRHLKQYLQQVRNEDREGEQKSELIVASREPSPMLEIQSKAIATSGSSSLPSTRLKKAKQDFEADATEAMMNGKHIKRELYQPYYTTSYMPIVVDKSSVAQETSERKNGIVKIQPFPPSYPSSSKKAVHRPNH